MLKVYFTASTSFAGESRSYYKKIVQFIEKNKGVIISGRQIIDERLLEKDKKLENKEIFQREKLLIDHADCIIAEVTKPSHGVGGEIVYALIKNKPVLALVLENNKNLLSPMVAGNPSENLFTEFYNTDKLRFVIKDFLCHVVSLKKRRGKLIVIDGGDGSGKTTQAHLLVDYLKKLKYPTKYVDFPQYYNSFHGNTVAKFLRGEFGSIDEVSPYLASLSYALDRASIKQEMDDFLSKGGYIVANRYATSSMVHQGAKFKKKEEREKFLKWIYELEYKVNRMPKENLVLFLYVPWEIGLYLTKNKPIRHYLKGENADIQEKDLKYRQEVEKMYLEMSKMHSHWVKVDCAMENQILPPLEIHKKILTVLQSRKLLEQDLKK